MKNLKLIYKTDEFVIIVNKILLCSERWWNI